MGGRLGKWACGDEMHFPHLNTIYSYAIVCVQDFGDLAQAYLNQEQRMSEWLLSLLFTLQ